MLYSYSKMASSNTELTYTVRNSSKTKRKKNEKGNEDDGRWKQAFLAFNDQTFNMAESLGFASRHCELRRSVTIQRINSILKLPTGSLHPTCIGFTMTVLVITFKPALIPFPENIIAKMVPRNSDLQSSAGTTIPVIPGKTWHTSQSGDQFV